MPRRSTLRLTKRIVERLKADDKDAIFWDRDLAGCRSDEILTLRWDDVDRTARVLRLRDAKTGHMLQLEEPEACVEAMEKFLARHGLAA